MVFGPFSKLDAEEIALRLSEKGVDFLRWEDARIRDRQISDWRNHLPAAHDLSIPFNPRFDFLDIEAAAIEKLGDSLARFGVSLPASNPHRRPRSLGRRTLLGLAAAVLATMGLLIWSCIHPLFDLTLAGSRTVHQLKVK